MHPTYYDVTYKSRIRILRNTNPLTDYNFSTLIFSTNFFPRSMNLWITIKHLIKSNGATEYAGVEVNDVARIRIGLNIRRPKKKSDVLQDKRIRSDRVFHDSTAVHTIGSLQFLLAVSHSTSADAEVFRLTKLQQQRRGRGNWGANSDRVWPLRGLNGSGVDEVTSSAPGPILGFHRAFDITKFSLPLKIQLTKKLYNDSLTEFLELIL